MGLHLHKSFQSFNDFNSLSAESYPFLPYSKCVACFIRLRHSCFTRNFARRFSIKCVRQSDLIMEVADANQLQSASITWNDCSHFLLGIQNLEKYHKDSGTEVGEETIDMRPTLKRDPMEKSHFGPCIKVNPKQITKYCLCQTDRLLAYQKTDIVKGQLFSKTLIHWKDCFYCL